MGEIEKAAEQLAAEAAEKATLQTDIGSYEEIARFIKEHGEVGDELLIRFSSIAKAKEAMEENYAGCYDSIADFAKEISTDPNEIPGNLVYYIDYEKMGRDMELDGDIFTIETGHRGVHIFRNH